MKSQPSQVSRQQFFSQVCGEEVEKRQRDFASTEARRDLLRELMNQNGRRRVKPSSSRKLSEHCRLSASGRLHRARTSGHVHRVEACRVTHVTPAPTVYAAPVPTVVSLSCASPLTYSSSEEAQKVAPLPAVHAAPVPVIDFIASSSCVYRARASSWVHRAGTCRVSHGTCPRCVRHSGASS